MSTSAGQVARLLSLVPYLQRRPGVLMREVATEFGISTAELRRDLGVLYLCGLPGLLPGDLIEIDMEAVEGEGRIYLSNADFLAQPLRFTPDEVLPLLLGLRTLRDIAGPDVAESIDRALTKLTAAAGESARLADRIRIGLPAADEPVREAITAALGAGVRLRLTYDSADRTTVRVVDPQGVQLRDGYAYLEAWSDPPEDMAGETGGWRSFRLDRIAEAELTDSPLQPHDRTTEAEPGWLDRLRMAAEVTLDLSAPATWVAEYYPILASEPRPDGGLRIRLAVADPGWFRSLLLRLGGNARVVEPARADGSARAEARAALDQYALLFGAEEQVPTSRAGRD